MCLKDHYTKFEIHSRSNFSDGSIVYYKSSVFCILVMGVRLMSH
jgi:hypothetical protein